MVRGPERLEDLLECRLGAVAVELRRLLLGDRLGLGHRLGLRLGLAARAAAPAGAPRLRP